MWSVAYAAAAADELGLLDALRSGETTAREAARRCGLDVRGCQVILDLLASHEMLESGPGPVYRLPSGFSVLAGIVRSLADRVRGVPPVLGSDQVEGARNLYAGMVDILAESYGDFPGRVAELISGHRVLDWGAGSGVWSLAIACAHPACRVTAIDLPEVLDTTRACVTQAGLAGRFDFLAGDFFELELPPESHDLVVVAQVFHLFGEGRVRRLLARIHATLESGGRIAIIEQCHGNTVGSKVLANRELSLFARTDEGQLHAFSSYIGWLRESGFVRCQRLLTSEATHDSLIVAERA